MSAVNVYKDKSGGFRYAVTAANGEHLVTSESYTTRTDAWRGVVALVEALEVED